MMSRQSNSASAARFMKRFAAVFTATMLSVAVWTASPSEAAVPGLDQIRVGIFLNLPGKYTTTVPAVTFTSAAGMGVGMRQPSGVETWFQTEANQQTRFALDDYKVKLLETTDFNAALTLLKRLKGISGTGWITSLSKGDTTVYQVTEGLYASASDAKNALIRLTKDSTVASLMGSGNASLAGPLHMEGPAYSSLLEARSSARAYGAAGIDAFAAFKGPADGGVPQYTVLVGAAADAASLNAVKEAAAKAGLADTLHPMDAEASYLLLRSDHTLTETAANPISLYTFAAGAGKVWLSPLGDGGIKLSERYNRSYRGSFEVSGLNNRLAVVNELPFEQYLYSVVGGEMPASWPSEALKAQAVAARSYALYQGFGFQIAHVVDSILSQTYGGIAAEKPNTIAAVKATEGEVALYDGKVIETVFSSSAGGVTADSAEIWGSNVPYLASVPSPDELSEKGLYSWYRIALADNRTGYMREDLLEDTGDKTSAGSAVLRVKESGALVRPIPLIQSDVEPVAKLDSGTRVVALEKTIQSNEMNWVRGPFTADAMLGTLKKIADLSGSISTLEEGERGPSGRVTSVVVNGKKVAVKTPDSLRSALGGLPSTRFDIDETARFTVESADGQLLDKPADNSPIYILGSDGKTVVEAGQGMFLLNGSGQVRAVTKEPGFRFVGTGNGHGVGLSQWGSRGLAENGYDYQRILKYYYKNVTIAKE